MLHTDINSCISLTKGTTPRFNIGRGIRQGCSLSPLLFIMAAELMSIRLKNSEIEGISIDGNKILISQLADDTMLFMKNDIPVKKVVRYLGIWVSKNSDTSNSKNIQKPIEKSRKIPNNWLQRDLTLFGRSLLTKTELISRLTYPAYSLPLSAKNIKEVNTLIFNLIWKNKHIKKADMIKNYEQGGIKAIDFETVNGVLKLSWLQSFLRCSEDIWFSLPRFIFKKLGGIYLLLKCDFTVNKLSVKLLAFHQQVLFYWKMIYKHNFSPHHIPLWNNRVILRRRKSVFMEGWMEKQIWSIFHMLEENGYLLKYEDFCRKYKMVCTQVDYRNVVDNIPTAMINLIRNNFAQTPTPKLHKIIIDTNFLDKKCNNLFFKKKS